MISDELRAAFIRFWQDRGARLQPSSSLIPYNDPTVLLTTAGMQQFVPYFLGREKAPHNRYVSVQKCFRTSDIDEVGDRSHLTFFEMLGNFSIGDYFKQEVIPWSLEFSIQHLGLQQERIWITIHLTDDEANQIWLDTGIPQERIKRFGDADNWWGPPGASGPCGPNSELYYEQGPGFGCGFPGDPPGCDCGRLEFWNLVFMQYFQDESGNRTLLPRKNVDTGMGVERAAVVMQGLHTIYDTDLFQPILQTAARIAGVAYGQSEATDYALRVLTDHGRGTTFLVLDGVVPGPGGREYVLRRLIRRAVLFGRRLGIEGAFLADIAETVIDRMAAHYPQLESDRARIKQVLANEEELFSRTLETGFAHVDRLISEARAVGATIVAGKRLFDLFQTYGYPPELTEELLREHGIDFDHEGYNRELEAERERARAAARFQTAHHTAEGEFGDQPPTEFLAWTEAQTEARILAVHAQDVQSRELPAGTRARLVLEASPFYPEGGGQVGDTGLIRTAGGVFVVEDTQMDAAGRIVHSGHVEQGAVSVGEFARADVDVTRRDRSRRHHTATHLLHRALKDVLGEATSQQGSEVTPEHLRFDFNHPRPLTRQELADVARVINERSMDDLPVHWEIVPLERARHMGAIMMFGEKYGDEVRVVSIGEYSRELCGGTHTHASGELGAVTIASESGIGSGKRRIVAYAGQSALDYLAGRLRVLDELTEQVGARSPDELQARISAMQAELTRLERELERRQHAQARESAGGLAGRAREVAGVKVVAQAIDHADEEELKRVVDAIRQDLQSGVVVLGAKDNDRLRFVAGVTPDLTRRVRAGDVVKAVARMAGGGGGGRPDFATGGGTRPEQLQAALEHTYTVVQEALVS
jgi:alanyl-tRNA synthetase